MQEKCQDSQCVNSLYETPIVDFAVQAVGTFEKLGLLKECCMGTQSLLLGCEVMSVKLGSVTAHKRITMAVLLILEIDPRKQPNAG
jgi:hypothetical protein